jgi:glycosyltransferase involved in cell wall biosynthesis
MKILWVPHTSFQAGVRARSDYFIERLTRSHQVHMLCWDVSVRRSPQGLLSTLRRWTRVSDGITLHHMPRLAAPFNGRRPRLTERVFRRTVRRIVAEHDIDVVVCACNWYALGFPPTDLKVPLIIDYFDLLDDDHEAWYLNNCDAMLCSSSVLFDRAAKSDAPRYYLPNGIEPRLFQNADGTAVRDRLGLNGARVVSLIGLTSSPRLYFLDAIERAAEHIPDLKCLLVGASEHLPEIRERVSCRPDLFRLLESVTYADIPPLFACSDVGLYPGDIAPHFDAALPIKVLEYSAAGKRVVVAPLEELKRLGFANLVFADPQPEAFAAGICHALALPPPKAPELAPFDIATLSVKLSEVLEEVVARGVRNGRIRAMVLE